MITIEVSYKKPSLIGQEDGAVNLLRQILQMLTGAYKKIYKWQKNVKSEQNMDKNKNQEDSDGGFMGEDEEILTKEEEEALKEKLKYYGYI